MAEGSLYDNQALVRERTVRSRTAVKLVAINALVMCAALQVIDRPSVTHGALSGALLLLAGYSAYAYRQLQRGEGADSGVVHGVGLFGAVVNLAAIAHLGAVSIVALLLPFIVFYRAQLDRRGPAWAGYLVCAGGYASIAALSYFGFLPLTSASPRLAEHNRNALLVLAIFMEVILALTFALATMFRKSAVHAMEALAHARRELGRRDALLEEARADLEQARDRHKLGRFTGRSIGPYLAHDVIGRGAACEVYYARHRDTGRPVALKVPYAANEHSRQHVDCLANEARLGRLLASPHVAHVVDHGEADGGLPYLALELLRGSDLSELLREHGRLPADEVVTLVAHAAEALDEAHAAGIVHRDVKPQNLMRTLEDGSPHWKLLDFGVATTAGTEPRLGNEILGTAAYMSAEQALGKAIDARSDVCSLALVAYSALTGRSAFSGPDASTVAYQAAFETPPAPSSLCAVSKGVDSVFAVALAKDAGVRFESAKAFGAALRAAVLP